jgi:hypothetical protein
VAKSGTLFLSRNLWEVNEAVHRSAARTSYLGRYMVLRRVAKSVVVSEGRRQGQLLGDSAISRLVRANI